MTFSKPEFIDNQEGNTLAHELSRLLAWARQRTRDEHTLDVASGYFNPGGFAALVTGLEALDHARILLGAEPPSPPQPPRRRKLGEPRGQRFESDRFRRMLAAHEEGMSSERDLLGFTAETDRLLERLVRWLRSGRVEVRRYEKAFLHGKAYILRGEQGVIAGSSNFTGAGLSRNLELNLGHYQPNVVERVGVWFDALWNDAVPFDLAAIYQARFIEYDPFLIYLRALWERYHAELDDERAPDGKVQLTTFQNDGLARARKILERYNGVLIADGVGLGKSFLAGRLIEECVDMRRQHAVLISPAALRDGTWDNFQHRHHLRFENLSYEQLAADGALGGDGPRHLRQKPEEYSMVLVDEAHAFRNADTQRGRALARLLQGTPPKQLVLLTATPVNNSLWDLYALLSYFVQHDAVFADLGIPSLKGRFDHAAAQDPERLTPAILFDLLDQVVVRRTRQFVVRNYPNERVKLADGTEVTIRFPDPKVRRVDYEIEPVLPGFFDEFADALAPDDGHPALTLARYIPSRYLKEGAPDQGQVALVGLLRAGLLKRFESSVHAFAKTTEAMVTKHDAFLRALDLGWVPNTEVLTELTETAFTEAEFEQLLDETQSATSDAYDVERLRHDVLEDRALLAGFAARARSVGMDEDPKLHALGLVLRDILRAADRDGRTDGEKRDRRKVLIFSYYADTVNWIEQYLRDLLARDRNLAAYRGRLASVAGTDSRDGVTREAAVFGFAPVSSEAPSGRADDRYDVLVATDVLAEGLNLQQCRNIINYDLPWNPMRLVQRHGRIDRIGSQYAEVFIRCFFPARRLDQMLLLEERLRGKIHQAAMSIGVEGGPLPDVEAVEVNFAETRAEVEALRDERPDLFERGGELDHTRTGEDYRQTLRRGMQERGDEIVALPFGAGSGFVGGQRTGWFFCARVLDKVFFRFVIAECSDVIRDSLNCLKLIDCTDATRREVPSAMMQGAYAAWETARADVYEEWTHATDPANLQPKVPAGLRAIADHLRRHAPANLDQLGLDRIIAAIEAPRPIRVQRELRAAWQSSGSPGAASDAIVACARVLGLMPFVAPRPLDPIDLEEVQLVCWMAVTAAATA